METRTVAVPNIGCNGCVNTIKSELQDMPGVTSVEGVVDQKQIIVKWDAPATWQAIEAKLVEIDYAPADA
ncbi:MAG: heavy-metal-associated domain-containing protein [Chloroflexota bacterium]